jgi:hypothetical protein
MVQLPLGGQLHQGVVERLFAGGRHMREGHDQGLPYGFDPRGPPLPRQPQDDGADGFRERRPLGLCDGKAVAVFDVLEGDDLVARGRLEDASGPGILDDVDRARLRTNEEGPGTDVTVVGEALGGPVQTGVPPADAVRRQQTLKDSIRFLLFGEGFFAAV